MPTKISPCQVLIFTIVFLVVDLFLIVYQKAGLIYEQRDLLLKIQNEVHSERRELDFSKESCKKLMAKRRERLKDYCKNHPEMDTKLPHFTFVNGNEVHQTLICAPYKAASESWRVFFQQLDRRDQLESGVAEEEVKWHSTNFEEWPANVDDYSKAFQVRHPLERLLSGYRFAFEQTELHRSDRLNEIILDKYDPSFTMEDESLFTTERATFKMFVDAINHGERDFPDSPDMMLEKGASSHWRPMYKQCNPCAFIAKNEKDEKIHVLRLENISEEVYCYTDDIKDFKESDLDHLYLVNQAKTGHSSQEKIKRKYFSQLTSEDLRLFYEKYKPDFEMYGFGIEDFLPYVRD